MTKMTGNLAHLSGSTLPAHCGSGHGVFLTLAMPVKPFTFVLSCRALQSFVGIATEAEKGTEGSTGRERVAGGGGGGMCPCDIQWRI